MIRVDVAPAVPSQAAEALALLAESQPAFAKSIAPPVRLFVASAAGEPARLLGAAALWPVPQRGGVWGFRVHCHVALASRRQGIGRALIAQLADEAARWGVPRLLTWEALPDGPATAFLQAAGWRGAFALHHFLADTATALPQCARVVDRLRRLGHVPHRFALLPLHEVPRAPMLALHCQEFHAVPAAASAVFDSSLADPLIRDLSVALWDGQHLAGYLLASRGLALPEVNFWASAPEHRSGWAAALLLHGFVERLADAGKSQARYHCNEQARAPMNFARRTGAQLERITQGWCFDVAALRSSVTPATTRLAESRRVHLSLAGLNLERALALCGQGQLPHLSRLIADGGVAVAAPASAARQAWRSGHAARAVGGQPPESDVAMPAGSAWVRADFDDLQHLAPEFWALDPEAVRPAYELPLAREARTAPHHVAAVAVDALTAALPQPLSPALRAHSARLLAHWASIHNLGVHWAGLPDWALLDLHFDGLPQWLAETGLDAALGEPAWWSCFDLMLGRYRQLLGPAVSLRVFAPPD
jgi:GNAT superfamily N-acetyltransferase